MRMITLNLISFNLSKLNNLRPTNNIYNIYKDYSNNCMYQNKVNDFFFKSVNFIYS